MSLYQLRTVKLRRVIALTVAFVTPAMLARAAPVAPVAPSQARARAMLARYYDDAWAGERDALDDVLATGSPDRAANAQRMTTEIADLRAAFPAIHYQVQHVAIDQDMIMAQIRVSGWQDGPFLGFPPSHRHVSYQSVDCFRVADGKIVAHWRLTDQLDVLHQIGASLTLARQ